MNVEECLVQDWAGAINCSIGRLPTYYLGLPLGFQRNSQALWKPVLDIFQSSRGMERQNVFHGGRIALVKAVLSGLPVYYLSLFQMPCSVANSLNKLLRNRALVNKWSWRFCREPNKLWRKVIAEKYGYDQSALLPAQLHGRKKSWLWNIVLRRPLFDWEIPEWDRFMDTINNVPPYSSPLDSINWIGAGNGIYYPKIYCELVSSGESTRSKLWKFVWANLAPLKVEVFVWKLVHGRVPTNVELVKRGVNFPDSQLCAVQFFP
ncbi:hypothetical protein F3Y22_tig00111582pilonHSYRG00680 [Hibiscus syriacus]|uniref:Reverse transcriptase zinc-binding domain-containing protein n=1 Tax=Hibiscus syriacus TaxID=106335 RepID=A0A6A2YJP0_HIBSY|nr:hypothetical protein F3Y22_tig00111582pilonHSYRG00680 [Hibiscus syriacus]